MNIRLAARGVSAIEIIIVLAILILLSGIGSYAFVSAQKRHQLNGATDSVVSELERAKANAMAGKNGRNFGVKFNATSMVSFSGDSYDAGDPGNVILPVASGFTLSNDIPNADGSILFSRLYGIPQAAGTITVTRSGDSSRTQSVSVGSQGEITVTR